MSILKPFNARDIIIVNPLVTSSEDLCHLFWMTCWFSTPLSKPSVLNTRVFVCVWIVIVKQEQELAATEDTSEDEPSSAKMRKWGFISPSCFSFFLMLSCMSVDTHGNIERINILNIHTRYEKLPSTPNFLTGETSCYPLQYCFVHALDELPSPISLLEK